MHATHGLEERGQILVGLHGPCLGLCATALALWGLWALMGLCARNVARGGVSGVGGGCQGGEDQGRLITRNSVLPDALSHRSMMRGVPQR